ncbi:MAG TPA: sodium:solute symporter [Saprospiraceae bacterium]|jgi:sodium/pantothenate symporter|nr:MAG: Na+/solute symporter [Candidatus Parvibacillus calidus]MCC7148986.1 sodium:solute symporter [Saprospiraceae bacterium]WKZ62106.1 MAG: sodium:solute symporter [Saprospiraceae bacterium]HQN55747.1 sodium:solute symporter [Saprospiraceae bacterium]HRN33196.1 sodium:solute symporter [Saprospiraceae bacterium]
MDLKQATILLLAVYAAILLFLVYRGARKTRTLKDYAIGSGFPAIVVAFSLAASVSSAATFIINPGFIAYYGWSAFLAMALVLPLGLYLSLIYLSKRFQHHGNFTSALTLPQWAGNRFNSKVLERLLAIFSLLMITFLVLICVGLAKIISNSLGADEVSVMIGVVVFVFGYMMFGGANALVYTNFVQAVLMLIVAVILIGSGYGYFEGGVGDYYDRLNTIDPMLTKAFNPTSPLFRDWFEVIFCNFVVGIAIVCQPHIITKSLLLRSEKDINKYLFYSVVVLIVFFSVVLAGFYGRMMFPDLKLDGSTINLDSIMSLYVVRRFSAGVGVLVVFGLLAAGMSTLESLLQSLSITITQDLVRPAMGKKASKVNLKVVNRFVIAFLALVTILVSYNQMVNPTLSVGILAQNGVYSFFSAAFIPVLFGVFVKDAPKSSVIAASIVAIVVHFSVYYLGLTPYTSGAVRNPAVASALAIVAAFLTGTTLLLIDRKKRIIE